ncbi:MAG TPA: AlpA family phage regulatory protein [Terracidiphilus sp.]|nr:AlpA family phage regulatory protein [Terracidiphilus sp.]
MDFQIVRTRQAFKMLGISVPTGYRWIAEGRLPRLLKLGSNSSGFLASDLRQFIADRVAESRGGAE